MKIVWVIRAAEGGMLMHLSQLLSGLTDFDIVIMAPPALQNLATNHRFIPIEIEDGIRPRRELGAIWNLARHLRKERPDLVHIHGLKAVLLSVPAAKLGGCRRLVFTAHNRLPQITSCWKAHTYHLVQKKLFRSLETIISVSDEVRSQLLSIVPEHRVITIRNGIVCDNFTGLSRAEGRAACQIAPGQLVLGTVARLIPEKGIGNLLEAASLVKNVIPNMRFVIVGDGPARSRFEAYRDALGLQNYVNFLGKRDDVPILMAGWDGFILPTFSEGLSLSVMEAMASRLPVIVSDLPSMREMVVPGRSGLLVPPKDTPALAAAILHLLKDLPKARAMGEFNRQRVRALFDSKRMVECTKGLYREMLERKHF